MTKNLNKMRERKRTLILFSPYPIIINLGCSMFINLLRTRIV